MDTLTSSWVREEPKPAESAAAGRPPVVASSELMKGGRLLEIRHNGETYRLQATRFGKLILTK